MPTVPAKVLISGTPENPILNFELPTGSKGEKGDPGSGWIPTSLTTENLDDIRIEGTYRQSTAANVTAERNYPIPGNNGTGVLEVLQQGTTPSQAKLQRYSIVWGPHSGKVVFTRTMMSGAWTPWIASPSFRVDNTVGKTVQMWDHVAAKDMLIYGDTGWRDISANLSTNFIPQTSSGRVLIRRTGHTVCLMLRIQASEALLAKNQGKNVAQDLITIPSRFDESPAAYAAGMTATAMLGSSMEVLAVGGISNPSNMRILGSSTNPWKAGEIIAATLTWLTNYPWPESLPGTAFGSIV